MLCHHTTRIFDFVVKKTENDIFWEWWKQFEGPQKRTNASGIYTFTECGKYTCNLNKKS